MRTLALVVCMVGLGAATAAAKPSIEIGRLTAPSRATPASIAAAYLQKTRAGYELERAAVVPAGDGVVVRYRQRRGGVQVLGGSVTVRVDGRGVVRRVASSLFDVGAVNVTPAIDRSAAIGAARARARAASDAGQAVLAIAPETVGGARLVYAVRFAPVPQLLENAVYFVDARDGRFLKRLDLLKYAGMARVFQKNPVSAGGTTSTLPFPDPFTPTDTTVGTLTSALVKGYDCVDTGEMKTINMGGATANVHICSITQEAKSVTQDFTTYMPETEPLTAPDDGCPGKAAQALDEFSEQHMYWHVATTYAFFRSLFATLGNADFKLRITTDMGAPLPVAVNLCTINLSTFDLAGPLVPFDNAFFSPGAGNVIADLLINGQDSIMFGQGSKTDFAYDGDVIAHEFTHAVIDTLGKLTAPGFEDAQGLNDDPGAMNEGLADYFSSALGGDPLVGEYGGKNIPGSSTAEGAVRDLTNTDLCADDRWGEVHQDSQAFSAALWSARVAVAGDPKAAAFDAAKAKTFDTAVLAAIQSFPDSVDMPTAATAIGVRGGDAHRRGGEDERGDRVRRAQDPADVRARDRVEREQHQGAAVPRRDRLGERADGGDQGAGLRAVEGRRAGERRLDHRDDDAAVAGLAVRRRQRAGADAGVGADGDADRVDGGQRQQQRRRVGGVLRHERHGDGDADGPGVRHEQLRDDRERRRRDHRAQHQLRDELLLAGRRVHAARHGDGGAERRRLQVRARWTWRGGRARLDLLRARGAGARYAGGKQTLALTDDWPKRARVTCLRPSNGRQASSCGICFSTQMPWALLVGSATQNVVG